MFLGELLRELLGVVTAINVFVIVTNFSRDQSQHRNKERVNKQYRCIIVYNSELVLVLLVNRMNLGILDEETTKLFKDYLKQTIKPL